MIIVLLYRIKRKIIYNIYVLYNYNIYKCICNNYICDPFEQETWFYAYECIRQHHMKSRMRSHRLVQFKQ